MLTAHDRDHGNSYRDGVNIRRLLQSTTNTGRRNMGHVTIFFFRKGLLMRYISSFPILTCIDKSSL